MLLEERLCAETAELIIPVLVLRHVLDVGDLGHPQFFQLGVGHGLDRELRNTFPNLNICSEGLLRPRGPSRTRHWA